MKKIIVLSIILSTVSVALQAAHYVYFKNSLNGETYKSPLDQKEMTAGGAKIFKPSLIKITDNEPSYDNYPETIKPGKTTWAVSTPEENDPCIDTGTCQMWKLIFDIEPQNKNETRVKASDMKPIHLAPADDIEVVYTKPTKEDPALYYGYIIYGNGDRFESENETNSGIPSEIIPLVHHDRVTKFPVHPKLIKVVAPATVFNVSAAAKKNAPAPASKIIK